jgi:hypothetical protein
MLDLLKKIFAGGGATPAAQPSDPVDYQGYEIVATPRQVSGGWSTEGLIRKELDGEPREAAFIRADTCMSREDAVQMAFSKARKIIDEQGDRVFQ